MKVSISGIRGIFGKDLTLQELSSFSRRFGSFIKSNFEETSCIIARDTRPSGELISNMISGCLLEQGIDVADLGIAPTPILFRESRQYSGAIMITASHNPLDWNGLKILIHGRGLYEEDLDLVLNTKIHPYTKIGEYKKVYSNYFHDLKNFISFFNPANSIKVGFDTGGGAACNYVNKMFDLYKIPYMGINNICGFSSRGPDPTTDPLLELCELVKENQLNFGFAFDIDGDRLVIVNNKGEQLSPDFTLLLCISGVIHNSGSKKFTISLDTSLSVENYITEYSGEVFHSKVGESNVLKKMIQSKSQAGGEGSSGGFIMPDFTSCRDGLLASLIVCSLDLEKINECVKFASKYKQIRKKLVINSEIEISELFEKLLSKITPISTNVLKDDGLKFIIDDNSWLLVRSSNTEHALRISFESLFDKADLMYKQISNEINEVYKKI